MSKSVKDSTLGINSHLMNLLHIELLNKIKYSCILLVHIYNIQNSTIGTNSYINNGCHY